MVLLENENDVVVQFLGEEEVDHLRVLVDEVVAELQTSAYDLLDLEVSEVLLEFGHAGVVDELGADVVLEVLESVGGDGGVFGGEVAVAEGDHMAEVVHGEGGVEAHLGHQRVLA